MNVLLLFAPSVYPESPPLGISLLKSYLQKDTDIYVQTQDLNVNYCDWTCNQSFQESETEAKEIRDSYSYLINKDLNLFSIKKFADRAIKFTSYWYKIYSQDEKELSSYIEGIKEEPPEVIRFLFKYVDISTVDYLGLSILSNNQFIFTIAIAKYAKSLKSDLPVIVGGAAIKDLIFIDKKPYCLYIDHIIKGEGEEQLKMLLKNPSILKVNDKEIEQYNYVKHLDLIPSPDYSDYDFSRYFSPLTVASLLTSRGCAWGKCAFCSHHNGYFKVRNRNITAVIDEIEMLKEKYKIFLFDIIDEFFTPAQLRKFSEEVLKREINIRFTFLARPIKNYSRELLELAYQAGNRFIFWGIESGSQEVLNLMNKGTKVSEIRKVLKDSFATGIKNCLYTFTGFPGESEFNVNETKQFLSEMSEYIYVIHTGRFTLQVGSHVEINANKYGLKKLPLGLLKPSPIAYIPFKRITGESEMAYKQRANKYDQFCYSLNQEKHVFGRMRRQLLLTTDLE